MNFLLIEITVIIIAVLIIVSMVTHHCIWKEVSKYSKFRYKK